MKAQIDQHTLQREVNFLKQILAYGRRAETFAKIRSF